MRQNLIGFLGFLSKEPSQPRPGDKGKAKDENDHILPEAEWKQPDERIGITEKPGISGEKQTVEVCKKLPETNRREKAYSKNQTHCHPTTARQSRAIIEHPFSKIRPNSQPDHHGNQNIKHAHDLLNHDLHVEHVLQFAFVE